MSKKVEEKALVQAVVVVDDFQDLLAPLTDSRSKGLVPLLNRPLIDFSLRLLQVNGVHEVYVLCKSCHEGIATHIKNNWSGLPMDVQVFVSETYMSLGDMLRDMDRKAKIKGDFILIRGDVVGNINISKILEEHKNRRVKDKGCVMTSIFQKITSIDSDEGDGPCIARSRDNKILWYSRDVLRKKTVKIPLQIFKENTVVNIDKNIIDTNISICSISLLMLYTDNVDHQTNDDFIRGTLDNEDILGNSMHAHFLSSGYTGRITDSFSYDAVSQELLSRWNYPFVPDKMDNFSFARGNIFLEKSDHKSIHLSDAVLDKNCMIGEGTCFGDSVRVSESVIGRNCKIGKNVSLKRCYVWDGVVIEDDCTLSHCIIYDGVIIKKGSVVNRGCILGKGVVVGDGVTLSGLCVRQPKGNEKSDKLLGKQGHGFISKTITHDTEKTDDYWGRDTRIEEPGESDGSPSESEQEDLEYGDEDDYVKNFYIEVMDNFKRGVSENISCDNLILEVNSMKHAYNIPINEVTTLIVQALLEVADSAVSGSASLSVKVLTVAKFLLPLIKNYIRDESSQADCLLALEEYYLYNKEVFNASLLVKVIKFLYDEDVLEEEVICDWFGDTSGDFSELIHKSKEEDGEKHEAALKKMRVLLRKESLVQKFIHWLQEADEESSDED